MTQMLPSELISVVDADGESKFPMLLLKTRRGRNFIYIYPPAL